MTRAIVTIVAAICAVLGTAAAHADGPVKLRIGWVQVGHVTPMYDILVKRHPALFPHYGKSYTAEGVRFNGTTPEIQAMAVGELEIASLAPSSFTLAVTNAKLDVRMVSDLIQDGLPDAFDEPFMVRKDGPIKTIEDVRGKRVATNAIGSASDNSMRIMFRKHGIKDSDFTTVEVNFANMFPMIEQGKVDLIAALPQSLKEIRDSGRYRTLFTAGQARGPAETVTWGIREDFIKAHRAALVDFFEDHLRALRWFLDPKHHDEAVAIAAQVTKQNPDALGYFFTKDDFYRNPDGLPNLKAAQSEIDDSVKLGILPKRIDINDHVDLSLIKEAKKRLDD
ncbi:MAG TPA: ABC transporter substrate-binding protein [Stellaceae bacterium]|nr:ABC transporter substrate-binding protein [Stellaceae bacterium]